MDRIQQAQDMDQGSYKHGSETSVSIKCVLILN
jgi:hypothetical protein